MVTRSINVQLTHSTCIYFFCNNIKMLDTCKSPTISSGEEIKKDTKHAPDLLEGPDVNDDGKFDTVLANNITF